MTTRRQMLIAIGAGALAPPVVLAQPQKVWRIGVLGIRNSRYIESFKSGLRDRGRLEARDFVMEAPFARSDSDSLEGIAERFVGSKIDMILTGGTVAAVAARKVTDTTPILFAVLGDPVGIGLAKSLRRPGGNVTGLTTESSELKIKHLDLLRQLVPGVRAVGFIYDPRNASSALGWGAFEIAAKKLRIDAVNMPARSIEDLERAFGRLGREKSHGVVVSGGSSALWESILRLCAKQRVPAVYPQSECAESGGLLSYAADYADLFRRVAAYADKIMRGVKPGELPIEQPTKFELIVNMKTAKALGLTVPQSILVRANRVIE